MTIGHSRNREPYHAIIFRRLTRMLTVADTVATDAGLASPFLSVDDHIGRLWYNQRKEVCKGWEGLGKNKKRLKIQVWSGWPDGEAMSKVRVGSCCLSRREGERGQTWKVMFVIATCRVALGLSQVKVAGWLG